MPCNEITLYFRVSSILYFFNLYSWKNRATAISSIAFCLIYDSSSWSLILSILRSAGLVCRLFEWLVRWHEIIDDCSPTHYFFHFFHVIACGGHVEWNCVSRTSSGLARLNLTLCRGWVSRCLLFSNLRICRHLNCLKRCFECCWYRIPWNGSRYFLGNSIRICNVGRWSNRQLNHILLLVWGGHCYLIRIGLLLVQEVGIGSVVQIVRLFGQKNRRLCLDTTLWLLWLLWLQLKKLRCHLIVLDNFHWFS